MSAEREAAFWREIVELVPGQYVYHHGTWLVGIGVAPKVVEFLRDCNVLILGFDGFEVDGTYIRARLDAIADFSPGITGAFQNEVESAAQFALRVLKELASQPFFFEFVLQFEDDEPFPMRGADECATE